jgi:hypothetical protein
VGPESSVPCSQELTIGSLLNKVIRARNLMPNFMKIYLKTFDPNINIVFEWLELERYGVQISAYRNIILTEPYFEFSVSSGSHLYELGHSHLLLNPFKSVIH